MKRLRKLASVSDKTQKCIDEFDSAMNDKPNSVEEFTKSDILKKTKKIYKRMEEVDELQNKFDTDDGFYDQDWEELKKRFVSTRELFKDLCKKLPGGNWASLKGEERIKAVDEYEKYENIIEKVNKILDPDVTWFNYYNF